jgi:hypothetical protein
MAPSLPRLTSSTSTKSRSGALEPACAVGPGLAALKANQTGEGLRLFLRSRGRDLYAIGGDEELMLAFSAVMRERPDRRAFNRTLLASLWSDIGVDE